MAPPPRHVHFLEADVEDATSPMAEGCETGHCPRRSRREHSERRSRSQRRSGCGETRESRGKHVDADVADGAMPCAEAPEHRLGLRESRGKQAKAEDASGKGAVDGLRQSKVELAFRESQRRSRLEDMRASLVKQVAGNDPPHKKRKKSLSLWSRFPTVDFQGDELKDQLWMDENATDVISRCSFAQKWQRFLSYAIPAAIGFLTAASGSFIEKVVQWLGDLRFGYCKSSRFFVGREFCAHAWVSWAGAIPAIGVYSFAAYTIVSVLLATTAGILVWLFAPEARGSGIPEVKTILGGFVMTKVLEARTLVVKIIGLCLSVSAGLSLGKEGPLVHVACCWANCLSKISARYTKNEAKQRELISVAAAAGVSVAFGAPLGGVLFSFEEVSTMFPTKTLIRSFFAAVVAALSLDVMNPTGSGKLTMFQTRYDMPPALVEYLWFLLLGILGGCIGSVFVHYNIKISAGRADGSPWRKKVPVVMEVTLIALCTALTSYPMIYTRLLSSGVIRSLFHRCDDMGPTAPDMLGLCDGDQPMVSLELACTLLLSALARFVQMTFTFGTGVPCGLFVPSLYTGACVGRILGMLSLWLNNRFALGLTVHPGIYAMVGAAAVLGGVCRVTISLVVIMFELTGGLQLIMPFMLAVLVAKWVGDCFTDGIYDCCIRLRGYPFLHEPEEVTFTSRVCDIMDTELECLFTDPVPIGEVLADIQRSEHGGFPLVRSMQDRTLLGYVQKAELVEHLTTELSMSAHVTESTQVVFGKHQRPAVRDSTILDLCKASSKILDQSAIYVVPETPLAQVHNIFRQLGVKLVLVARFGKLVGIITKKSFLQHMHEGHIGHIKHDPVVHTFPASSAPKSGVGLEEPLIP